MAAVARARWVVLEDDLMSEQPLVIRDVGPWNERPTVTNDAEAVVAQLAAEGELPPGRRLFYYDSEGSLDEIVVENGRFVRFAPAPNGVPR